MPKHQRRFAEFDNQIVRMYSRRMSTRDIQAVLKGMYGTDVSPDLISHVAHAVVDKLPYKRSAHAPARVQPDAASAERLARYLRALASPIRIQLLAALRVPKDAADVRIAAGEERADLRADRTLTRTTIVHHLQTLEEVGLVARVEGDDGKFVVNQQVLFSIVEDLAGLTRLRPTVELDVGETRPVDERAPRPRVAGPRLVLVGGPREGETFPLAGPGPWTIGRASEADVRLDYDPHVSRRHAVVGRAPDGRFVIEGLPTSTNAAFLDFAPVRPGVLTPLAPGSIVLVGSSRLVFQDRDLTG